MKKALAIGLAAVMAVSMSAPVFASDDSESGAGIAKEDLKIGAIYIGDENEGYTAAHMAGIDEMVENLGLDDSQVIEKTLIGEDEGCYDAAADLADQGCQIIFANSFGHETYILEAAGEYPDVQFCHATGTQAASSGLSNMHNYFTNIYEARYVSGVVAGLKLNQMIEDGTVKEDACKIGYVGDIEKVNPKVLQDLLERDFLPIVFPVGFDTNFDSYNINADDAACAIAEAVHAEKLVFLSDIEGVYKDKDDPDTLISELHVHEAEKLISEGYVGGGMIPKLQNCIDAIEEGVNRVHILDGRIPHSLLLEIFTNKGIGTAILREDGEKYYNEHE